MQINETRLTLISNIIEGAEVDLSAYLHFDQ